MSSKDKSQGVTSGMIVESIACTFAMNVIKRKKPAIIIAYAKGSKIEDIRFVAIDVPKKELYSRNDILAAICRAEKVKKITYCDFDGNDKDIYICRERTGEVYDFVERDNRFNRFLDGFSEIESVNLKFETEAIDIRLGVGFFAKMTYNMEAEVKDRGSLQYALANVYNACLLGRLLSYSEFQLETGDGKRVKYEIRSIPSKYLDLSMLYIKPETYEGEDFVSSYITDPINVIDGTDMTEKVYRLRYRISRSDYYVERCN